MIRPIFDFRKSSYVKHLPLKVPFVTTASNLITICTYNESANIVPLLDAIRESCKSLPPYHILVVDDNSPDGTGRLVDEYSVQHPEVRCLHRERKEGLGAAVMHAIAFADENGYEIMLFLDGDLSHPPKFIPDLFERMNECDIVIGSRYVPGGRIEGWDLKRHVMSRGINFFARLFLGIKARDCSGNFRCLRVSKVARIRPESVRSRGYSFQEEFLYRCQSEGCVIGETPITFVNRKHGKSNLNLGEIVKSLWLLTVIAIRRK